MKFHFFKKFFNSEYYKNVFTLFWGTSIAHALPFLAMFILSRIFSEDLFGIYFIYSSVVMILNGISTLKYELAVVLPEKESDAINFVVLAFSILLAMVAVLFFVALFFKNQIAGLLGLEEITGWLIFVPVSIFAVGIFRILTFWSNRQKTYKHISYSNVIKSISLVTGQLGVGFSKFNGIGLIPGVIFGQITSAIHLFYLSISEMRNHFKDISLKRMKMLAVQYKDIPLFNTLMSLMMTFSSEMPIFLLTRFYGIKVLSQYGFANKVLSAPVGIFNSSVAPVFYREASEIFNKGGDIFGYIKKIYSQQFKIGIIPFLIVGIFSPVFFRFFFGEEWSVAGEYAQLMTPWLFLAFLNFPIEGIVTILRKQKQKFVINFALLAARFFALSAGFYFYDSAFLSILFYILVGIVFNLLMILFYFNISKKGSKSDYKSYS